MSITGHYIDAPNDQPNNWKLKTEQLAFDTIEGRHTGKNIASILTCTVKRYELNGKVRGSSLITSSMLANAQKLPQVGWITADGAAVNGTTIREFEQKIDIANDGWTAQEHDILYVNHLPLEPQPGSLNAIRCMEHSLHLAAKHFVEAVAPPSPTSIHKKVKAALVKAHINGGLNLDEFDKALSEIDLENVGDQGDGDENGNGDDDGDYDESSFTPGDSLGKALALVKQVHDNIHCAL